MGHETDLRHLSRWLLENKNGPFHESVYLLAISLQANFYGSTEQCCRLLFGTDDTFAFKFTTPKRTPGGVGIIYLFVTISFLISLSLFLSF